MELPVCAVSGPSWHVLDRGRQVLNERGLRPTAQRLTILSLLAASDDALTIAELSALGRRAKDPFSAATLYRTVALLVKVGLVSRATTEDGVPRYGQYVGCAGETGSGSASPPHP